MLKIALVRPPCIEPFPPDLGLAYISSFLKREGCGVSVFDINIDLYNRVPDKYKLRWRTTNEPELQELYQDICAEFPDFIDKTCRDIVNGGFNLIGFSVWRSNLQAALSLAEKIKILDKDIPIVFGGPHCYPLWGGNEIMSSANVDWVVYGEGELAFLEIIECLGDNAGFGLSRGGFIRDKGEVIDLGPGDIIHNLDSLPFPDYAAFNLGKYPNNELFIGFNRGCINKCYYCSTPGTLPAYRERSADSIFREILFHTSVHGRRRFLSASPGLNYNLKVLDELCCRIISGGLDISWGGFAMVRDMDASLLRNMRMSGCDNLVFGLESGSQRMLNKMNKLIKVEAAEKMLKDISSSGIDSVTVNFIIGFPGETEGEFAETLDFIQRNRKYIRNIGSRSNFWVEPYSEVYNFPARFGVNDFGDRLMRENHNWESIDGSSSMAVRERRKQRFERFLKDIGYE